MKVSDYVAMVSADLRRAMKSVRGMDEMSISPDLAARMVKGIASTVLDITEAALSEKLDANGHTPRPKVARGRKPKATQGAGSNPGSRSGSK